MAVYTRQKGFAMVGADGNAWVAPVNTVAPVGVEDPAAEWLTLGAASDDGYVYGIAESSTSWTPFGLVAPWRTEVTSSVDTMQATFWEVFRPAVMSVMYRVDVADLVEDATSHVVTYARSAAPKPDPRAYFFEFKDGLTLHRLYMPNAEVSDRGNITYKQTEEVGYQCTVTAYPDDLGNTVYHTVYTAARQTDLLGGGGTGV